MVFSALALFLMVADTRFQIAQPLRAAVATVLYPVQWVAHAAGAGACATAPSTSSRCTSAQAAEAGGAAQAGAAVAARQPGRAARAGERRGCASCWSCASRIATPGHGGRGAVRRGRPVHPQGHHRQGPGPGHRGRLAGDRRIRRAGPGDAGAPADQRSDAGDRPRPGHPRAEHPHRRAQRRLRRRRRRTAARWNCASWPPMPTCRPATCSPPAAWTASIRRACRWPRSRRSSAAPIPPSPASPARPQALVDGARHVMVLAPHLGASCRRGPRAEDAAAPAKRSAQMRQRGTP